MATSKKENERGTIFTTDGVSTAATAAADGDDGADIAASGNFVTTEQPSPAVRNLRCSRGNLRRICGQIGATFVML